MKTRSLVASVTETASQKWFLVPLLVALVPACGEASDSDGQDESGVTAGDPTTTDSQSGSSMPAMPTAPSNPEPVASPMPSPQAPATASNSPAPQTSTSTPMPTVSSTPTTSATPGPVGTGGSPPGGAGSPPMGNAGEANAGAPVGGMNTGGSGGSGAAGEGGSGGAMVVSGDFSLTSEDYADGEMIPDEFTCEGKPFGEGISPQLAWSGAPAGAMSFALTFIDVTLTEQVPPNMNGYHWAMWDIPVATMSLPQGLAEGATLTDPEGAKQYSPLSPVYLGPCPSFGQLAMDTYEFTLYALDIEMLTDAPNNVAQLEQLFLDHAIGTAKLSGWSDAAPQ